MLKVRLLNDGGYGDMENVKFPVIVKGEDFEGQGCDILGSELIRAGATVEVGGILILSIIFSMVMNAR